MRSHCLEDLVKVSSTDTNVHIWLYFRAKQENGIKAARCQIYLFYILIFNEFIDSIANRPGFAWNQCRADKERYAQNNIVL